MLDIFRWSRPVLATGLTLLTIAGRASSQDECPRWTPHLFPRTGVSENGFVQAFAEFDDGSGPALYIGGRFFGIVDTEAAHIAKFDGTSWSPLGSGLSTRATVDALVVFDDGGG